MNNQPARITVQAAGVTITTGAASANAAIPNNSVNTRPRYVRVAATAAAYVRLVSAGAGTAAAGDTLVQPGDAVILAVSNMSNIAAVQVAAAGIVQISPLEDS